VSVLEGERSPAEKEMKDRSRTPMWLGKAASRTRRWVLPLLVVIVITESCIFGGYLWITRPQTRFASSFTEEGFRSLKLGIPQAEAIRTLGEPLSRREVGRLDKTKVTVCYYSEPLAKNFKHRALVFDRSETLIEKVSYEVRD